MPAIKYRVELSETERSDLDEVARRGKSPVRMVKRALALLKVDDGQENRRIAEALSIHATTVARLRARFVKEGMDSALNERPRPGEKRKLI